MYPTRATRPILAIEQVSIMLKNADGSITNGWLGDGLNDIGMGRYYAEVIKNDQLDEALESYLNAVRAEHWDRNKTTYDAAALHQHFLSAMGALALAKEEMGAPVGF